MLTESPSLSTENVDSLLVSISNLLSKRLAALKVYALYTPMCLASLTSTRGVPSMAKPPKKVVILVGFSTCLNIFFYIKS